MKKRFITNAIAILMVLILLAGCSKNTKVDAVKEITLSESWGFADGFATVMPLEDIANFGPIYYLNNFYETLVNYEDGKIVPGLADSWSVSDDGLIYTFHLKKGVKFTDGEDFNAAAVKKNLEMIPKLLGKFNGSFGLTTALFKEIKAVDDYTVEVRLSSPYYGVLQEFTIMWPMGMMSPNAFNEDGTVSDKLLTSTMGTGPYMFNGQTNGQMYTFLRNPEYRGEKPEIEKFNIKIIPDNEAKALAMRSGEIDIIVGSDRITSYDGFKEFSVDGRYGAEISDAIASTRYLGFNLAKVPFNDKKVRLAISHAIDKQNICDNLLYGIDTKADELLSKSLPYCNVPVQAYEYDIEKGKKILEEAGWMDTDGDGIREKDGMKLEGEIVYNKKKAIFDDLAMVISSSLKEIGIDMKLTGLDLMAWHSEVGKGEFAIVLRETYGIPHDPYTTINNMNTEKKDYVLAQGLVHLEDGDDLVKGLSTMGDEKEIQDRYNLILTEVHKNMAFVPISNRKELVVFNAEKIDGYEFNDILSDVDISGVKLK